VHIADTVEEFMAAINQAFLQREDKNWLRKVAEVLKLNSWDLTWNRMRKIIYDTLEKKEKINEDLTNINYSQVKEKVNGSGASGTYQIE
ncbi:MAG: hypothetical protein ACM3N9_00540, partial [Syntrophothermus sp.]